MNKNNHPFDFNKIDTSGVHKLTDAQLLERLKGIPIISSNCGGWGIIAEVAKRLERAENADD